MKKVRNLTAVVVALSLVLAVAPAQAHPNTGNAGDDYCSWSYGYGRSNANTPFAWASAASPDCKQADADLTLYYQGTNAHSKYCSPSSTLAYCEGSHNTDISHINVRVSAMDWERETWQTLLFYHA